MASCIAGQDRRHQVHCAHESMMSLQLLNYLLFVYVKEDDPHSWFHAACPASGAEPVFAAAQCMRPTRRACYTDAGAAFSC